MRDVFLSLLMMTAAEAGPSETDAGCGFRVIDANGSLTLQGLAVGPTWTQGHYQLDISVVHAGGRSVSRQSGAFVSNGAQTPDPLSSSTVFIAPGGRLEATLRLTDGDRETSCSIERQN